MGNQINLDQEIISRNQVKRLVKKEEMVQRRVGQKENARRQPRSVLRPELAVSTIRTRVPLRFYQISVKEHLASAVSLTVKPRRSARKLVVLVEVTALMEPSYQKHAREKDVSVVLNHRARQGRSARKLMVLVRQNAPVEPSYQRDARGKVVFAV